MPRVHADWAATRRVVISALVDRLREFTGEDPAGRWIDIGDDEVVVHHGSGTWSWRVGKDLAVPLELDTRSIPWQVELWVRERSSAPGARVRGLFAFSVPHSRRIGAIHPSDDPVAATRDLVERELERQAGR